MEIVENLFINCKIHFEKKIDFAIYQVQYCTKGIRCDLRCEAHEHLAAEAGACTLKNNCRVTFWCRFGAVFVTFLSENVCKMLRFATANVAMSYRPNVGRQQRVTFVVPFWCRFRYICARTR